MTGLRPLRAAGILAVVTALASAIAYAASGSSLKIVLPANARVHHKFTYSIKGTFSTNVARNAWVIGLSQPKARACRATEPQDWKGPSAYEVDWARESSSPFTLQAKWHGVATNPRRLCVYLYSQMFWPLGNAGTANLLATAQTVIPK